MKKILNTIVAHMLIVAMAPGLVLAEAVEALDVASIEQIPAEQPPAPPTAEAEDSHDGIVHMGQDGTLAGRLRVAFATGKKLPAKARVTFSLDGTVINSAETDAETGRFTMTDLEPGQYLATAEIEEGTTQFPVQLLSYNAAATPHELLLDATLTPTPEEIHVGFVHSCSTCENSLMDGVISDCGCCGETCDVCGEVIVDDMMCGCGEEEVLCEEIIDECPMAMGDCCGGFGGGGYGGGGMGGWGLLGAGGLAAGLTALALQDDDSDRTPVSPF